MVLLVLLLPRPGLRAVGDLLRAISFYLAGILLHAGELIAVGDVVFLRPVADLLLDRRLAVSRIGVVAQDLQSAFAVFLFQFLEEVGHRPGVISCAIHNDRAGGIGLRFVSARIFH